MTDELIEKNKHTGRFNNKNSILRERFNDILKIID